MGKRTGHLYEKLFDEKQILQAIEETCLHKGKRRIVQKIKADPNGFAKRIKALLTEGFLPSEAKRFQRQDPGTGKIRDICSVPLYPDQIIHRLAVNVMKETIAKGMDPFCVGCVPGRGCNAGKKAVLKWIRKGRNGRRMWILKFDIRHFYASIDREKLFVLLEKKINDKRFLAFLWNITSIEPKGLAIGVYSSPWLGNFYLQAVDHQIKQDLKIKHFTRNVDDFVLMDTNRRKLKKALTALESSLAALGLTIKPDWRIYPIDQGDVDYVGFRVHKGGKVTIRKRNWRKLRRDCLVAMHHPLSQKRARSLLSRMGLAKNSDSRKIFAKYLTKAVLDKAKSKAKGDE